MGRYDIELIELAELTQWFSHELPDLGEVVVVEEDRHPGVFSLTGPHLDLLNRATYVWCKDRGYRLTSDQLKTALIDAALLDGLLVVT